MQKVERPRLLIEDEKNFLFSLKEKDIDLKMLEKLFADKKNTKAMFKPNDFFNLPKGKLYNKMSIKTTVGRYIFNRFILSDALLKHTGYINTPMDGGGINKLENELSEYLLEDKVTVKEFSDYIDKMQWLGFISSKFINSSLTYDLLEPPKETKELKKDLIQKYKKEIDSGDLITINKIEKELIADAKKRIKDIPDLQIYDSGGRGSFGNNYKNSSLLRGAIKNLADPSKVFISTKSLMEGIPGDELQYYADTITQASYSRAVGTREGGYESKKLSAAFQNIVLDKEGSDCRTKKTIGFKLEKSNINMFMYRYIVEPNGKLTLLTSDNINEYVGRFLNFRTPMYCTSEKYCSKCSGELYYMLGITNIGILSNRIGTSLLNAALKAFHDTSLKVVEFDISKYIE
ncbi:putative DNA-directed RNA-polymerase beta-subunit [Bacillus phage vB_BpuM-BpSp]|nr:putative DNA-directed RNA-polymerase beta-subunit [Bacillus phage vB_BpuM-BpSp]